MTQSEYPSVLLIYTGGTIGMIENAETGALESKTEVFSGFMRTFLSCFPCKYNDIY